MSALPRSIGSRLFPVVSRPTAARAISPKYRAYGATKEETSVEATPKTTTEDKPTDKVSRISEESPAQSIRHKPDYNVAVDYRTSWVVLAMTSTAH